MKCLENLSLVDDKCLEDLQNDIEKLIASYIDLHQMCYDILDTMVQKDISQYHVRQVAQIFDKHSRKIFGDSSFLTMPKWVENTKDFAEYIILDEKDELWEYIQLGLYLGKKYDKKISNIQQGYWVYREGTNWEIMIETTKELFKYFKAIVSCFDSEEVIDIARALKDYGKRNGFYKQ